MDETTPRFNGSDYVPARDNARLSSQFDRVFEATKSGEWLTLGAIAKMTGDPEASVSAQLRHLRKERFGGHTLEKRYIKNGLYEYRVLLRSNR